MPFMYWVLIAIGGATIIGEWIVARYDPGRAEREHQRPGS